VTPHLFIIHFPIALILLGALVDLGGLALDDRALRIRAGQLIMLGSAMAFLAFVTGEGAKLAVLSVPTISLTALESHQQWGSVGTWGLVGAALLRTMWRNRLTGLHSWLNLGVAAAAALLVVFITLSGTAIRHVI
jgi:uncharacterized membrane protein